MLTFEDNLSTLPKICPWKFRNFVEHFLKHFYICIYSIL